MKPRQPIYHNSTTRWTRRELLGMAAAGGLTMGWGVPQVFGRMSQAAPAESDRILVVFQFSGGNDGLSTVVPHGVDEYYRARPRLAVPADQVLTIDDTIGLVDTAAPFREMVSRFVTEDLLRAIAEELGVSRGAVSKYTKGIRMKI